MFRSSFARWRSPAAAAVFCDHDTFNTVVLRVLPLLLLTLDKDNHMPLTTFQTTLGRLASRTTPAVYSSLWSNYITTRGMASKKHKAYLKHAKGYRGRSKNCFSIAIRRVHKAWQYAYRDRKVQRREWRKLWITRIQAGVRQYSWSYSRFVPALSQSHIELNRKILAELAANEPFAFKAVVDVVEHETKNNQQRKV